MQVKINAIPFEIEPVPGELRRALFAEPLMRQGTLRDVWEWNREDETGRPLTRMMERDAVPLGNAITFFVPRADGSGIVHNNQKLAKKMHERFVEACGAKSLMDVLKAVARIVPLPRVVAPLARFEPLKQATSYRVRMATDFSTVRLKDSSRNLSAYLFLPGQVAFRAETIGDPDAEALEALYAQRPELRTLEPSVVLPPGSEAAGSLRRLAVAQRIRELQPISRKDRESGPRDPEMQRDFARAAREWRVLSPDTKPAEPAAQ